VGGVIFRLARQSRGFCRFRHPPNQAQPEPGQFDMAPQWRKLETIGFAWD